jgi:hypothetical protein
MDEWLEQLARWGARLDEWNQGFHREYRRLARSRTGLFRRLSAADEAEIAAEARRAAGEDILVDLFGFFDGLCGAYLAAELAQHRAKVRKLVGEHAALLNALWSYVEQAPELIRGADDARRLELALAAVSIDDGRVDIEQFENALGRLYLAASRAGIDPAPHFAAAAKVSNPGSGGGGAGTRALLEGFDRSYSFEHNVRPQLSRVSA